MDPAQSMGGNGNQASARAWRNGIRIRNHPSTANTRKPGTPDGIETGAGRVCLQEGTGPDFASQRPAMPVWRPAVPGLPAASR